MYADIIIDITHEKLDKVFQYRVPEELEGDLRTGAGVIVPFGRGNRWEMLRHVFRRMPCGF